MAAQHGITMSEFRFMCGREMQNVMKGVQLTWLSEWERTRILACFIINKDVERRKQIPLHKVFTLPGEKTKAVYVPTTQETQALIDKWDKFKSN